MTESKTSNTFQPGDHITFELDAEDAADLNKGPVPYNIIKHTRRGEAKAPVEAPYFMDQADEALFAIQSSSVGRTLAADTSEALEGDHSTDTSSREATPREEDAMRSAEEWANKIVQNRGLVEGGYDGAKSLSEIVEAIQQDALRSRLPPEWVMVPEEPTEAMLAIGKKASNAFFVTGAQLPTDNFPAHAVYKAMLAAAKEGK